MQTYCFVAKTVDSEYKVFYEITETEAEMIASAIRRRILFRDAESLQSLYDRVMNYAVEIVEDDGGHGDCVWLEFGRIPYSDFDTLELLSEMRFG